MMKGNNPVSAVQGSHFFSSPCHLVELFHVSKLIGYLLTIFHVYTIEAMFTIM